MSALEVIAGVLMAVGPPLAYADQYVSICKKHDSRGFSTDVTGILIIANITRLFYWIGARFQTYLLVQSILMIVTQYGLLYVCVLYRPANWRATLPPRPGNFWQWASFGTFLEATAILIVGHAVLFLILHKVDLYVQVLGFVALGLEATLPIPQVIANYRAKSTAGFRHSVLASWAIGDAVKTIYFFVTPNNPLQFKLCGLFQLSIDLLLCGQTFLYRKETARDLAERAELRDQAGVAGTESLLPARPAPSPKAVEAAAESLLPRPLPPAARHYDEESEVDSRY
ncbi:hypothetical protein JCM8115_004827 [Rhodotorula mucilaginosa]|uniref:PQ-loop repeat-containing protein 1 n=1 Tax=Rhodotorula mucilaginosa TaxID=5537 RepID=A0A9P6W7V0_RHOMI|nr:hypothetical protein C6P46_002537 [Rhodotorula mucilaginosa]TKA50495.1 hypothetical protein B0A53_06212 [Rhodotorula sp. CCFEE 5036]